MPRTIFVTAGVLPQPAPDYHTLSADPVVADAKQVPEDGRVSIDGHEWRFVNVLSIQVEGRNIHAVGVPGQRAQVFAPAQCDTSSLRIGLATRPTIEETLHRPIVVNPFGRVVAGKA